MKKLLVVILIAGCGLLPFSESKTYQAVVTTARNADAQFKITGDMYNSLCPAQRLTVKQCADWKAFVLHYQTISEQVYTGLKAAKDVKDVDNLLNLVTNLATELALYYGTAGGK